MPPPSTRSNSSMPVEILACCSSSMSEYSRAVLAPLAAAYRCPAEAPTLSVGLSSTNEFQAPQSRHCPSHLLDCAPHSWQTNTVLVDLLIACSSRRHEDHEDHEKPKPTIIKPNDMASSCSSWPSRLREKLSVDESV